MGGFKTTFPWTWAILASRNARSFWKTLFLVIVIALFATEARAWIFRWQARQMLNDLRALEMDKTPAAQALKLRDKWPPWRLGPFSQSGREACTVDRCKFDVAVMEWDWLVRHSWSDRWWGSPLRGVTRAFEHFGLRRSDAVGEITIRHGLVTGLSAVVTTWTRDEHWQFMLIAYATVRPNLFLNSPPDDHPNLHVRFQGPPNHGGCHPCKMTRAEYTSQISRDLFLKVTNFDLSCLTSFRLCNQYGDMMPDVKRMVEQEGAHEVVERLKRDYPCTTRTIETLGRDVMAIAVMRVRQVGVGRFASVIEYDGVEMPQNGTQEVEYDLVEKLKWRREEPVPSRVEHEFEFSGPMVDSQTHLLSREWFRPGERLIVFLDPPRIGCGAVPANAANLQAVRAGIAEDRSDDFQ